MNANSYPPSRERGISIIEFMIAIALGLIVLAILTVVFANASRARSELEKSNQLISGGRSALELMNEDLRMAGYMAEFDTTPLTSPAALPTATEICSVALADLKNAMMLHVQGINNNTSATPMPCLSDVKSGSDIIVIRRASSCTTAETSCQTPPFIQAALCSAAPGATNLELAFVPADNADYAAHFFQLDSTIGAMSLHKNDCTTLNDVHQYQVHIYFVANNHENGDGIPTLKRAELRGAAFTIVPMVEGVDNMQIEYGVDTAATSTGVPSSFSSDPGSVLNWRRAVVANVHLLMRNSSPTSGYSDTRSYTLGDTTVAAPGDAYKRHVYSTSVRFAGPSWRLAP